MHLGSKALILNHFMKNYLRFWMYRKWGNLGCTENGEIPNLWITRKWENGKNLDAQKMRKWQIYRQGGGL